MSAPQNLPDQATMPRWASPEVVAEYLGVTILTVRRYLASGMLTGYRLGGRLIRIDLNQVDAMLRGSNG